MIPRNFLYVSPANMLTLFGGVSGPVQATYELDWLVDALPGRPLNAGAGSATWTVTNGSKPVNFATLVSSNAGPGSTITFGGALGGSTVMAYAGRVPLNPFYLNEVANVITDVSAGSASVSFTAGSGDATAGQFIVGKAMEIPRPVKPGAAREYTPLNTVVDPQMGNIPVYRKDKQARTFSGASTTTELGLEQLIAWHDSTNDNELISVIVPERQRNDAWCVKFTKFGYRKMGMDHYEYDLAFIEVPRRRWP